MLEFLSKSFTASVVHTSTNLHHIVTNKLSTAKANITR